MEIEVIEAIEMEKVVKVAKEDESIVT